MNGHGVDYFDFKCEMVAENFYFKLMLEVVGIDY